MKEFEVPEVAVARYMRIARLIEELVQLTLGVPDEERKLFNEWIKERMEKAKTPDTLK